MSFDTGALDGFLQQGFHVNVMDLSKIGSTVLISLAEAIAIAEKEVLAGRVKTIVVDTISALDEILTVFFRNKGFEKWDLYGNIKIEHMRFAMAIKRLPCNILFVCHARHKGEFDAKDAAGKAQQEKKNAEGFGNIIPDITGGALNHYRRDASFEFPLMRGVENGINGRWFYPQPIKGFDTKTRLLLEPVIPADWRKVLAAARS